MGRISKTGFSSRGRVRTGGTVSSSAKQIVSRSQRRKSGQQITSAKRTRIISSSIRARPRITTVRKTSPVRKFPLRTNKIINKASVRARKSNRILLKRRTISKPTPPRSLQKVSQKVSTTKVTQFGFGGGDAINNVFGLIQQTSQRNADRKAQLKAEGRLPFQQPRREPIINIEELFGFDF